MGEYVVTFLLQCCQLSYDITRQHLISVETYPIFVKLQSTVQTSVLGLGVEFVFPLLQQEQQEQE